MSRRATVVYLDNQPSKIFLGDPMLDTSDGVLIIQFDDGTHRTFNWDYVVSFYHMTAQETTDHIEGAGE